MSERKQVNFTIVPADEGAQDRTYSNFCAISHTPFVPAFGPYVSAVVLAAVGTAQRFENTHQVLKFAGLDLNAQRSGLKSRTTVPVISKKGKATLRYALYQAALVASSFNHHVMAYYRNLLTGREREPGIRTKMRVKLAAKLLIIAWTLMKKKEPFNPERLKTD